MGAIRKDATRSLEKATGTPYSDTNYIFPSYIVSQLPKGLAGLVIAVIFAAAMTALSGELTSLATASMVDFYARFRGSDGPAADLLVSRILTALWGVFACFVALRAGGWHASAIELVNRLGSLFYGSILGVFMLAVLAPRAKPAGAFYGLMLGILAVGLVATFTTVHFLWWNLIGAVVVFAAGTLISALSPGEALPRR